VTSRGTGWSHWGWVAAASTAAAVTASTAHAEDAPPPPAEGSAVARIRVLTFNAFIAPGVSPELEERLEQLGPAVGALEPDLVALQEVWREEDASRVADALRAAGLPYQRAEVRRGTPPLDSAGLITASRFPIEEAKFFPFTAGEVPAYAFHVDWMATKGVLVTRVRTPFGLLDFANTHLHSGYALHDYLGVRVAQMSEIASFLPSPSPDAPPLVLGGDLNSTPESLPFRLLVERTALTPVDPKFDIDAILVRRGAERDFTVLSVETVLTAPVQLADGRTSPLSDHPGILAVLESRLAGAASLPDRLGPVTAEALAYSDREIRQSENRRWPALVASVIGGVLGVALGRRGLQGKRRRFGWLAGALVIGLGTAWLAYLALFYWPRHEEDLVRTKARLVDR
jgi:endonuclease/exonuclease/phosphatase family metal-dependent hydrolase